LNEENKIFLINFLKDLKYIQEKSVISSEEQKFIAIVKKIMEMHDNIYFTVPTYIEYVKTSYIEKIIFFSNFLKTKFLVKNKNNEK
jgi:hypothetical protein